MKILQIDKLVERTFGNFETSIINLFTTDNTITKHHKLTACKNKGVGSSKKSVS